MLGHSTRTDGRAPGRPRSSEVRAEAPKTLATAPQRPGVAQWFDLLDHGSIDEIGTALTAWPELVHQADARGQSPLMHAIGRGQWRVVSILCEQGADVAAVRLHGEDASSHWLTEASAGGLWEGRNQAQPMASMLACHYPPNEGFGRNALTFALERRCSDAIVEALACDPLDKLDGLAQSPLGVAIEQAIEVRAARPLHRVQVDDAMNRIALLLRLGACINAGAAQQRTPLMQAARAGDAALVQWLLQHGAAPLVTVGGLSALGVAALHGHGVLVEVLADATCAASVCDSPACLSLLEGALFAAVDGGHQAGVNTLLDRLERLGGAPRPGDWGARALTRAVAVGMPCVAHGLLGSGAGNKLSSFDRLGLLETCARSADAATFGVLWAAWGVDVQRMPAHRYRLLAPMAAAGWVDVVTQVVERPTDPRNAGMRDKAIARALLLSIEAGCAGSVRCLLPHVPGRVGDGAWRDRLFSALPHAGGAAVLAALVERGYRPGELEALNLVCQAARRANPGLLKAALACCDDAPAILGRALKQVDSSQGMALLLAHGAGAMSQLDPVAVALANAIQRGDGAALDLLLDTDAVQAMTARELVRIRSAAVLSELGGGGRGVGFLRYLQRLDEALALKRDQ